MRQEKLTIPHNQNVVWVQIVIAEPRPGPGPITPTGGELTNKNASGEEGGNK